MIRSRLPRTCAFYSKLGLMLLFGAMVYPRPVAASDFRLVPGKSRVEFKIRHLGVGAVDGVFAGLTGGFKLNPSGRTVKSLEPIIPVQSLNTGIGSRDDEIKGESFLQADRFPEISFSSKRCDSTESGTRVTGMLTFRGTQKQVTFYAGIPEIHLDAQGKRQARVSGYVVLNWKAFGLGLNNPNVKDDDWLGDELQVAFFLIGQEL